MTKINSAGTQLIYSTYLGGSGSDTATAIALSNGSTFITGYTDSVDFPTKAPTLALRIPSNRLTAAALDAFVTQLEYGRQHPGLLLVFGRQRRSTSARESPSIPPAMPTLPAQPSQRRDFPSRQCPAIRSQRVSECLCHQGEFHR